MRKLFITLSLILSPAISVGADAPPPACNATHVGMVQCMAGKQCTCKFFRKSEMAGTPDRFDWDCGIMQPNCLDYQHIESNQPYNGPSSVIIDKNNDSAVTTH